MNKNKKNHNETKLEHVTSNETITLRADERADVIEIGEVKRNTEKLAQLVEENRKGLNEERKWRWKNLALALIAIGVSILGIAFSIVR